MHEDDTRTRILNVAGEVFAEQGFEKTTVREICGRAEANVAAVNYHFGDKERLYIETLRHAMRFRTEQTPLPEWSADTPAEVRLRDFVRVTMARMLVVQGVAWQERLLMREMLQPSGACLELVEEFIRPHFQLLLAILDGLVPAATPRHQRHQLAFSLIGQCRFYRLHDEIVRLLVPESELKRHFTPEKLADHITDVMLAALGRKPFFVGQS